MGVVKTVGVVLGAVVVVAAIGLLLFLKEFGQFADEMNPYNDGRDNADSGHGGKKGERIESKRRSRKKGI